MDSPGTNPRHNGGLGGRINGVAQLRLKVRHRFVCPVTGWGKDVSKKWITCQQGGEIPWTGKSEGILNFILAEQNSQDFWVIFFGRNLVASISFQAKLRGEVGTIPNFVNFHLFNFVSLRLRNCENETCSTKKNAQLLQLGHQVNLCQKISRWVETFLFFGRVFLHKTELFSQTWWTFVFKYLVRKKSSSKLWEGKV